MIENVTISDISKAEVDELGGERDENCNNNRDLDCRNIRMPDYQKSTA